MSTTAWAEFTPGTPSARGTFTGFPKELMGWERHKLLTRESVLLIYLPPINFGPVHIPGPIAPATALERGLLGVMWHFSATLVSGSDINRDTKHKLVKKRIRKIQNETCQCICMFHILYIIAGEKGGKVTLWYMILKRLLFLSVRNKSFVITMLSFKVPTANNLK